MRAVFDGSVHDVTRTEMPVPADAAAREALLRRVHGLAAVSHPHLVPVVAAEVRSDGVLEVLRASTGAADLATLLAVRGTLTPPEAAGVLVSVAQALAALHGAGLTHGPLEPGDVVVGTDGMPALRPRLRPDPADGGGPAGDVHAAARLVEHLVGRRDDEPATALRAVLAAALAPDPDVRPEAGTLAAWAHDAVEPRPVRLPEPAALAAAAFGGLRPRGPRRAPTGDLDGGAGGRRRAFAGTGARTTRRRADDRAPTAPPPRRAPRGGRAVPRAVPVVAAVAAAVVALTAVALEVRGPEEPVAATARPPGVPAGSSGDGPQGADVPAGPGSSGGDPTRVRTDPTGAAAELTRRRVDVLAAATASVEDLAAVSAAGSPALAADAALLERITREGAAPDGASVVVHGTELVARPATDRAEVTVSYALGGGASRTATLSLVWTPDGWRVHAVS